MNGKKGLCCILIISLIGGLTLPAMSLDSKSKGKLALVGILSGLGYLTHTLVTRDRRATEALQARLGPPKRVTQFERGFDHWRVNYYRQQYYIFRNNRFIYNGPLDSVWHGFIGIHVPKSSAPLTDTRVSGVPRWLPLYPSHQQLTLQSAAFYPYPLEDERLLPLLYWQLRLR